MKISRQASRLGKEYFRASLTPAGRVDEAKVRQIVSLVAERKPRHWEQTLRKLQSLIALEQFRRHVTVESATALSVPQQKDLLATLAKSHGADLTSEFRVVPELLGGMRVQIGSDVLDGSVKSRLDALREQFN